MRVFIAGASEGLGIPLIKQLAADGHEVTAMTRSPERGRSIRQAGAESLLCDVMLERQLVEAIKRADPEIIVEQLSAVPECVDEEFEEKLEPANLLRREGTRNLIAAAREAGVGRFVAQSIAYGYAPDGDWVKGEEAPLDLHGEPPRDRIVSAVEDLERQVLDFGGTVLRYGYLYGPNTEFGRKGPYAEVLRKRQLPIVGSAEGRWSFIHARDAAKATALALEQDARGVFNIVDDEPAPAREWIPVFAEAVGAKGPRKVPEAIGSRMVSRLVLVPMSTQRGASNAKAKAELNWTPEYPSWRSGFGVAIAAENRERWKWTR